jgi:dolichol-phosphate mannosyltransferase
VNLIVVVPTYNEAEGIEAFLDSLRSAADQADILVVDDQSPDGTGELVAARAAADDHIRLISRDGKKGLGEAYRAGFAWAVDKGYDVIVQMDADLSHPPQRIAALVEAVRDGADLAIGSRYVPGGGTENWGLARRFISWAGNTFVRLVLNVKVTDATAGFRAYTPAAFKAISVQDSQSNGYSFQIENTWRARRNGLKIVEVPITFTDRTVGMSKMSNAIVREAITRVLLWRWQELTGRGSASTSALLNVNK